MNLKRQAAILDMNITEVLMLSQSLALLPSCCICQLYHALACLLGHSEVTGLKKYQQQMTVVYEQLGQFL